MKHSTTTNLAAGAEVLTNDPASLVASSTRSKEVWEVKVASQTPRRSARSALTGEWSERNPQDRTPYALQLFEPRPNILYPLEMVEHLAQVPRRLVLTYCRHGLISPVVDPEWGGYCFTDEAIHDLRRIEYFRVTCGINLTGIKLILGLTKELQQLRHHRAGHLDSLPPTNPQERK